VSRFPAKIILAAAFSALTCVSATALVFGPSNLSLMGYPEHRCMQPRIPYSDDQYLWDSFRRQALEYVDCVDRYVAAGNNDIRAIQDAQREATNEADSFVQSIRR
jgi:hypothetical protein